MLSRYFALFLAPYLVSLALPVQVSWLTWAFAIAHLISIPFIARAAMRSWSQEDLSGRIFWSAALVFLIARGAYLEYPGDPWEHLRRTFLWTHLHLVSDHYVKTKFAYFWNWSLLFAVPIEARRASLSLIGGLWEWLALVQVAVFANAFGMDRRIARLQAVAFFLFFGTSIFGLRYYALSSSPLAMIAYLQALGSLYLLIEARAHSRRLEILTIIASVALMLMNHVQEAGFFFLSALTMAGFHQLRKRPDLRAPVLKAATLFFALSLIAGKLLPQFHVQDTNFLGQIRIWNLDLPYFKTYGIAGALGLVAAAICFRRAPMIAALTLMPALIYVTPTLAHVVLFSFTSGAPPYRLIYAMPFSFMLVLGMDSLAARCSVRRQTVLTLAALIALSAYPKSPFQGRLLFQVHPATPGESRSFLDPTLAWFSAYVSAHEGSRVFMDDQVDFILNSIMGRTIHSDRLLPGARNVILENPYQLRDLIKSQPDISGLLLADLTQLPTPRRSRFGEWSNHWLPYHDFTTALRSGVTSVRPLLEFEGWTKEPVPPFFDLYSPPKDYLTRKTAEWKIAAGPGEAHLLINPVGSLLAFLPDDSGTKMIDLLKRSGSRTISDLHVFGRSDDVERGVRDLLASDVRILKTYLPPAFLEAGGPLRDLLSDLKKVKTAPYPYGEVSLGSEAPDFTLLVAPEPRELVHALLFKILGTPVVYSPTGELAWSRALLTRIPESYRKPRILIIGGSASRNSLPSENFYKIQPEIVLLTHGDSHELAARLQKGYANRGTKPRIIELPSKGRAMIRFGDHDFSIAEN